MPKDAVRTSALRLGPFLSSTAATAYLTDHPEVVMPDSPTFHTYVKNLPDHAGNVCIASDGSVAAKR
eukprot:4137399-Ditylum_brightwellii.AAC.1